MEALQENQIQYDDSKFFDLQLLLGFQLIHYGYFIYRNIKEKQSLFQQIGPTMILKTCLILSFYIAFKKIKLANSDFMMGHLIIAIIFQIGSLLVEKQFAQIVYQFTISVQLSYFMHQMTNDSVLYVQEMTQYAQSLHYVFHIFKMLKFKESKNLGSMQLKFQIFETMLWITLSCISQHDLISLKASIFCFIASLFCYRVQYELLSVQEKKEMKKQKKE